MEKELGFRKGLGRWHLLPPCGIVILSRRKIMRLEA